MIIWGTCKVQSLAGTIGITPLDNTTTQVLTSTGSVGNLLVNQITGKSLDLTNNDGGPRLLWYSGALTITGNCFINGNAQVQIGTLDVRTELKLGSSLSYKLSASSTAIQANTFLQTTNLNSYHAVMFAPIGAQQFGITNSNTTLANSIYDLWNFSTNTVTAAGLITAQTFNATSDQRLKTNITPWSPHRSILNLPVYEFDFVRDGSHHVGCLAQDLQKICPEMVHEDQDGYLTIEESKLVYLLLDEVQRLKQEVEQLKMDCLCQIMR